MVHLPNLSRQAPKRGPLENGDIVKIRVRVKADSADLGTLRQYGGQTDKDSHEVPGVARESSFDYGDERLLQFEIEIFGESLTFD